MKHVKMFQQEGIEMLWEDYTIWDSLGTKWHVILQILPTHAHVNALLCNLPQPGEKQVSCGIEGA